MEKILLVLLPPLKFQTIISSSHVRALSTKFEQYQRIIGQLWCLLEFCQTLLHIFSPYYIDTFITTVELTQQHQYRVRSRGRQMPDSTSTMYSLIGKKWHSTAVGHRPFGPSCFELDNVSFLKVSKSKFSPKVSKWSQQSFSQK